MEQADIERIEEENVRLRTALEQALMFVEEFQGSLPAGDRFAFETLISTIGGALERPRD